MRRFVTQFFASFLVRILAGILYTFFCTFGFSSDRLLNQLVKNLPLWVTTERVRIFSYVVVGLFTITLIILLIQRLILSKRISWKFSRFLVVNPFRKTDDPLRDLPYCSSPEFIITQFYVEGKNKSTKPIENVHGYLKFDKTETTLPILINGMDPKNTYGIPAKSTFIAQAIFPKVGKKKNGYTIRDFWEKFGPFTFNFEYGGRKFQKVFSEKMISKFINDQAIWQKNKRNHLKF